MREIRLGLGDPDTRRTSPYSIAHLVERKLTEGEMPAAYQTLRDGSMVLSAVLRRGPDVGFTFDVSQVTSPSGYKRTSITDFERKRKLGPKEKGNRFSHYDVDPEGIVVNRDSGTELTESECLKLYGRIRRTRM